MAYNIFSQPQGPVVPINLFSENGNAGIQGGNNQKTLAQNIVGGITEGIQTGQKIIATDQAEQINQHTIEQFPQADAAAQARLEYTNQVNELNRLKIEHENATKENQVLSDQAKYKFEIAKATQDTDNIKTDNEMMSIAQGDNIADKQRLVTDPRYVQRVYDNPNLGTSIYGSIYGNLDETGKAQAQRILEQGRIAKYKQTLNGSMKGEQEALTDKQKAYSEAFKTFGTYVKDSSDQEGDLRKFTTEPEGQYMDGPKGPMGETSRVLDPNFVLDKNTLHIIKDANGKVIGKGSSDYVENLGKFQAAATYYDTVLRQQNGLPILSGRGSEASAPGTPVPTQQPDQPSTPETPIAAPTATQAPSIADQRVIVQKNTDNFNGKVASNPNGGTAKERLLSKRKEYQSSYNPEPPQTAVPSPTAQVPPNMPLPKTTETPTAILSNQLQKPVSFNFATPKVPQVSNASVTRINSDPYLSTETPLMKALALVPSKKYQEVEDYLPSESLVKGVSMVESGGNPDAVSPTGVRGTMQVTKATAAYWGLNRDIPEQNVLAGKLTLAQNLARFGGNLPLSLAAYNAGAPAIADAVKEAGTTDWTAVKAVLKQNLSAAKYKETTAYPEKVLMASLYFTGNNEDHDKELITSFKNSNLLIDT